MKQLKRWFRLAGKQPQPPIDAIRYQWPDLSPNVLSEYNNKNKHRIIGMTPAEAKKPSTEVDAKMAMELVARRGRRVPSLQIVDSKSV